MSYILDALRKSETERASQSAPTVTTVQNADVAEPTRTGWLLWLVPLNLVLLTAVAWLVLRSPEPEPALSAPAATSPAPAQQTRPAAVAMAPTPALNPTVRPPQRAPAPAPAPRPVRAPAPAPAPAAALNEDQLRGALRSRVAALEFSTHIYADEVDLRAVSIDGERLGQGQRSSSGVEVVEITPDGAILGLDGQRVAVDVMARWQF